MKSTISCWSWFNNQWHHSGKVTTKWPFSTGVNNAWSLNRTWQRCRCQHLTNGFLPPFFLLELQLVLNCSVLWLTSSHLVTLFFSLHPLPFLEINQIPARLLNSLIRLSVGQWILLSMLGYFTEPPFDIFLRVKEALFTPQRWQSHFFISLRQNEIWKCKNKKIFFRKKNLKTFKVHNHKSIYKTESKMTRWGVKRRENEIWECGNSECVRERERNICCLHNHF